MNIRYGTWVLSNSGRITYTVERAGFWRSTVTAHLTNGSAGSFYLKVTAPHAQVARIAAMVQER